jgi:hypothetical protein
MFGLFLSSVDARHVQIEQHPSGHRGDRGLWVGSLVLKVVQRAPVGLVPTDPVSSCAALKRRIAAS